MLSSNTPEHVFRFMQLRPAIPLAERPRFELASTALTGELAAAPAARRTAVAARMRMRDDRLASPEQHLQVVEQVETAARSERTWKKYADALRQLDGAAVVSDFAILTDALLVRWYAPESGERFGTIERLAKLYAVSTLPGEPDGTDLSELLTLPIVAPSLARSVPPSDEPAGPARASVEGGSARSRLSVRELDTAVRELTVAYEGGLVVNSPDEDCGDRPAVPLALNREGLNVLSDATRKTLNAIGIDPAARPVYDTIRALEAQPVSVMAPAGGYLAEGPAAEAPRPARPGKAVLRPAGIADLLVVKQQIARYEATEIAHVENVMPGETRSRNHRLLERSEEVFIREEETTREQENELETAERFELNREVSKTIKTDQKFGFDLSLSGKYGPTVEFSSNASLEMSSSEEQSTKSSSTFARDVMSRSLEKLTERVREERRRTVIRESEEINLHEFKNDNGEPVVGIYQFLDKIYANRIFNFGKRMMFDFMVPEPASYLWYLQENPSSLSELPEPPRPLSYYLSDASAVSPFNYVAVAARYGATGIAPPPSAVRVVSAGHTYGEGGGEGGQPRSTQKIEFDIPDGYRPRRLEGRIQALTDNRVSVYLSVGGRSERIFRDDGADVGNDQIVNRRFSFYFGSGGISIPDANKLALNLLAYETNNYTVSGELTCDRDPESYRRWQIQTFETIQEAYLNKLQDYQSKVQQIEAEREQEEAEARAEAPYGDSPLMNQRTILKELKKHAISIITRQRYETTGSMRAGAGGSPPWFDFDEAASDGSFIRFFEQAFEWDQMQYVFYPYYWANQANWASRFEHRDVDPMFQEFLQAGEARVVAPVRPGFERAIAYYLETGSIWGGASEPPAIGSDLYVSIITEIEERTGRSKGEIPVGDIWESRLPTPLVMLRRQESLPAWENRDPAGWDWHPVESGDDDDD
ncbi:hypothetical protein [Lentisalinibacter salinarum]|uniref:hypothetical protein n=1 Tax=Lentisalinibacter salinarum TaxID=2992239 RepID=UPI003870A66F